MMLFCAVPRYDGEAEHLETLIRELASVVDAEIRMIAALSTPQPGRHRIVTASVARSVLRSSRVWAGVGPDEPASQTIRAFQEPQSHGECHSRDSLRQTPVRIDRV